MSFRGNLNRAVDKFLTIDCKSRKVDIDKAHQIFDQMLLMTPPPPVSCFSTLLGALAKSGHLSATVSFYKRLDCNGVLGLRSNHIILNILLNGYSNMKYGSVGFSVLGVILKNGYHPDIFTFNALVKGLCLEEKLVEAVGLLSKMFLSGCAPTDVTFTTVINSLCTTGNVIAALKLHREMVNGEVIVAEDNCKRSTISCTLIDGSCIEWPVVDAQGKDARISPSIFSYNCLIDGLCRLGKDEDVKSLLFEMTNRGLHSDATTYSMVITLLCKQKYKVKEGMKALELMILGGKVPNLVLYSQLMDGYCKIGRLESAMRLFTDMNSKGIFADTVTKNILLKDLFHVKKVGEAVSIFQHMKRTSLKSFFSKCPGNGPAGPDRVTYSTMMNGLCKNGLIDKAEELFLEMQDSSISSDVYVYGCLIDGLFKQGYISKAQNLFYQMLASGVSPDEVVYSSLINGLCKGRLLDKAKEIFLQMQSSGVSANVATYNTLIYEFYRSGDAEEANKLLEKMSGDGILPDATTFRMIINNIGKKGSIEQAAKVLDSLIQRDKLPDCLIEEICLDVNFEAVVTIFSLMGNCGYAYDRVIYNMLIREYCKAEMLEDAHNLLVEMKAEGCSLYVSRSYYKLIKKFAREKKKCKR